MCESVCLPLVSYLSSDILFSAGSAVHQQSEGGCLCDSVFCGGQRVI